MPLASSRRTLLPWPEKLSVYLVLGLAALTLPARADVVVFDDHFDDNDLGTNTSGIGAGFSSFIQTPFGQDGNTYARETNSLAQLSSSINAAQRESIVSKNTVAINAGGTLFEFRGVSFTNQPANGGAPNTDRLFVGVGNTGPIADDFFESGADNMPAGFWIQFMSDSIATGSGNGAFTGTSTLFYKGSGSGPRTALASWTFDTLFWDDTGTPPNNYAPVLNVTLTLGAESWALNITGDTTSSNPINFSGTYAGSGIANSLNDGLSPTHFAAFNQTEAPGIIMSIDRMVATLDGDLIVTTPQFSTPHYGFATNQVRAGESVSVSSMVISAGTPALQWQMEDSSAPGTFTNIPSATATNLSVNTSALGDSVARGLRLLANEGLNSVTSAVVTLTVHPAVPLSIVQDTTPPGPEVRNTGLTYTLSASFAGNLPITYKWQKSPDSSTWTDIPNATNSTYQIASLTLGDTGYYRLSATNSLGTLASTASQLTVVAGSVKYIWSLPTFFAISNFNADQILTNFPNTKIAGAMLAQNGNNPVTVTLSSGSPIAFARPNNWATLAGGTGFGGGAFPGTNLYTTTGNGTFNNPVLNNFYSDGASRTITMNGLVVGQQYSVQLFALDGRGGTLNPPAIARTANYQDPADATDTSATFTMADFVYVVGTFYASNTTETVQQNLLNNGAGNFNCMVLRAVGWNPPPYMARQPLDAGAYLGGSVTLTGAAAGDSTIPNPTITYQWQAGPAGGPYTNLVNGAKYSGATTASLTVNNINATDAAAVYVLVASNGGGSTTSREAVINAQAPPTPILLGHWLAGSPDYTDVSGYTPATTHDGFVSGLGTVYYFTNDVPPGATGTNALYLGGNVAIAITNTSLALDTGYTNTFDDTINSRFTVMFWAKGYPPGTWGPAFIGKRGEDNVGWQIRRINVGNPGFTLRGTAGADDPAGSVAVDTNSWHHYAATWDSLTGVRRFYVDGRLSTEVLGDTGTMALASNFYLTLGARASNVVGTNEAFFTGTLYDVRIYNYAAGLAEIGTIGRVPPVPLTFQLSGNQLVFTWPYGTLVEATNLLGPWTAVAGTSPYTNNTTGPQKFFRTRNP